MQDVSKKWKELTARLAVHFDNEAPDMNTVLFLIGVQELGKGPKKFSKRQKEELVHIAICRLFSEMGYYELKFQDQDGWPHWELIKPLPAYSVFEQEHLLKQLIIHYFEAVFDN